MSHAILLAIACDPKLKVGISRLRRPAGGALVQWFSNVPCVRLETPPPRRDFPAMACLMKKLRAEKNQLVAKSRDNGSACCHGPDQKLKEQKSGVKPRDPFDFQRQNVGEENDDIGEEMGKREKER